MEALRRACRRVMATTAALDFFRLWKLRMRACVEVGGGPQRVMVLPWAWEQDTDTAQLGERRRS
jgi:hypothetical protein